MSKRSIISVILSLIVLTAFTGISTVDAKDSGAQKSKVGIKKKKIRKHKKHRRAKAKKKSSAKKKSPKKAAPSTPDAE